MFLSMYDPCLSETICRNHSLCGTFAAEQMPICPSHQSPHEVTGAFLCFHTNQMTKGDMIPDFHPNSHDVEEIHRNGLTIEPSEQHWPLVDGKKVKQVAVCPVILLLGSTFQHLHDVLLLFP